MKPKNITLDDLSEKDIAICYKNVTLSLIKILKKKLTKYPHISAKGLIIIIEKSIPDMEELINSHK